MKQAGWTVYYDLPDYKIYYKFEPGSYLCSLYLEKVIEAPMINLMSILAEAQLYNQWVPMTRKSEVIASVSHFRKAGLFEYSLPWPLYPRSMLIQACGM
jgi:hypothetical protein